MSAGYRNEVDAALAQAEALRQENAQLKGALAAEQATLMAERQQHQAQLQAVWAGRAPTPIRTGGGSVIFAVVAVVIVLFIGGFASFFMMRGAPSPAPYPVNQTNAPMPVG